MRQVGTASDMISHTVVNIGRQEMAFVGWETEKAMHVEGEGGRGVREIDNSSVID